MKCHPHEHGIKHKTPIVESIRKNYANYTIIIIRSVSRTPKFFIIPTNSRSLIRRWFPLIYDADGGGRTLLKRFGAAGTTGLDPSAGRPATLVGVPEDGAIAATVNPSSA